MKLLQLCQTALTALLNLRVKRNQILIKPPLRELNVKIVNTFFKSKATKVAAAILVATVAVAANSKLGELNSAIKQLLAPLNHKNSLAQIVVKKAEVNKDRAVAFRTGLLVKKVGNITAGALKGTFDYSFPVNNSAEPKVKLALALESRHDGMRKILLNVGFTDASINQMFEDTEKSVRETAGELLKQYGDAAKVKVVVNHVQKDKDGKYKSMSASLSVQVDLSKLPAATPVDSVLLTEATVNVDLDLSSGIKLTMAGNINKKYSGFQSDQAGLKEVIEAMLNRDEKTLGGLSMMAQLADAILEQAVGGTQPHPPQQ